MLIIADGWKLETNLYPRHLIHNLPTHGSSILITTPLQLINEAMSNKYTKIQKEEKIKQDGKNWLTSGTSKYHARRLEVGTGKLSQILSADKPTEA